MQKLNLSWSWHAGIHLDVLGSFLLHLVKHVWKTKELLDLQTKRPRAKILWGALFQYFHNLTLMCNNQVFPKCLEEQLKLYMLTAGNFAWLQHLPFHPLEQHLQLPWQQWLCCAKGSHANRQELPSSSCSSRPGNRLSQQPDPALSLGVTCPWHIMSSFSTWLN